MEKYETATFAGGCFWCIEAAFHKDGINQVISGYTGGKEKDPTYEQVCSGKTGHLEAVRLYFDPKRITYMELLDIFWHQIDPTDPKGQFADKGSQYMTAIFYHTDEQKKLAEESVAKISKKFDKAIATRILPATDFYPAEEYHQEYYKKNPVRYKTYKFFSGRDKFLKDVWK